MPTPLDLLTLGIAVIPCYPRSKRPVVRWERYQHELPDPRVAALWFRPGTPYNAAAICGWNGLTVFDFDTVSAYDSWLNSLVETRPATSTNLKPKPNLSAGEASASTNLRGGGDVSVPDLAQTYSVRTARGVHVYLYVRETPGIVRMGRHLGRDGRYAEPWGEIKGRRGYVLIPPSIHPTGARYEAIDPDAPILSVDSVADVLPEPPSEALAPPTTVFSAAWLATDAGREALANEATDSDDDGDDLLVFVMRDPRQHQEDVVDRIKAYVPILSLFPDARASGRNRWYVAHCPWHDDRNESLWIDTQRGLCGCYAGCLAPHRALNVVGAYAKLKRVSRRVAVRELAASLGVV